jgi:hypothetical protein
MRDKTINDATVEIGAKSEHDFGRMAKSFAINPPTIVRNMTAAVQEVARQSADQQPQLVLYSSIVSLAALAQSDCTSDSRVNGQHPVVTHVHYALSTLSHCAVHPLAPVVSTSSSCQ